MDYYELLGVTRSATDAEIKRAYRRLSFQYHPDKNSSPEAEELYKNINAAYDVLGDSEKRRAYDQRGVFQFDIEPQQHSAPRHRDPRYRRRPQPQHRPQSEKYTPQEVMAICMKYLVWVNRIGFVIAFFYALDYYLPYTISEETVSGYNSVYRNSGRYRESYFVLSTSEGTSIKIREPQQHIYIKGETLTIAQTKIYSTIMSVRGGNDERVLNIGTIYGGLGMFPIGVLFASAIALTFPKRPHLAFNLSIICAAFLLITLFLILFL
jgi:curved DNA-binding protein CbpA